MLCDEKAGAEVSAPPPYYMRPEPHESGKIADGFDGNALSEALRKTPTDHRHSFTAEPPAADFQRQIHKTPVR